MGPRGWGQEERGSDCFWHGLPYEIMGCSGFRQCWGLHSTEGVLEAIASTPQNALNGEFLKCHVTFTSIKSKNKTEKRRGECSSSFEMQPLWQLTSAQSNFPWCYIIQTRALEVLREKFTFNEPLRSYLLFSPKESLSYGAYLKFVIMNCFTLFIKFHQWDWGQGLGFSNETEDVAKF